jgi:ketol-acid reductoisomerase
MIERGQEAFMRITRFSTLRPLRGKTVGIIGYGSQGRAQALNLRDCGIIPWIGLPGRSASRVIARRDGFKVLTAAQLVKAVDIMFVLAPDHLHGEIFGTEIAPHLRDGQMLVFAHASSVHFKLVKPPRGVDVVLVAPLGPGKRLRELRGWKEGVACFVAVHQNATKRARPIALALAKGIGCIPAGAIETTFAEEAIGDLFGEQAVLCGGVPALLQAGVETLVQHGANPARAYLECVYQLDLIVDLLKTEGIEGMYAQISPTAAFGARLAGPRIVTPAVCRAMKGVYRDIVSGSFMRHWVRSAKSKAHPQAISSAYIRGEREVLSALSSSGSKPRKNR